jgi:hypothetical protein
MEPSPVLVAIREDLARLEAAAALEPPLDDHAMARATPAHRRRAGTLERLATALRRPGFPRDDL